MSIIIYHYRFQITALLYLVWPSHDRHHCGDYKVRHPEAPLSSLRSSLSSEWLISRGRDKRLVSMATTWAHFNMPAVCTDKAWHYVSLSFSPSADSPSAPCTNAGNVPEFLGIWRENSRLARWWLKVKGAKGRVRRCRMSNKTGICLTFNWWRLFRAGVDLSSVTSISNYWFIWTKCLMSCF